MPLGRPSKYKPEYCEMLIEHAEKGLSFEAFAGKLKISKQALYRWLKKEVAFRNAKKKADGICLLFWEEQGMKGLWDPKNFNSTVWIFNMKNRFLWRDRREVEGEVKFSTKKEFEQMSDKEVAESYKEELDKIK